MTDPAGIPFGMPAFFVFWRSDQFAGIKKTAVSVDNHNRDCLSYLAVYAGRR
jgi:hypothetical protein